LFKELMAENKEIISTETENEEELYYIEKNIKLSDDHVIMYNELRNYCNDILSKKIEWNMVKLNDEWLKLSDKKYNNNEYIGKMATNEMYEYLKIYGNKYALIRCLTGSDYNIKKAKLMILEQCQWRIMGNIDNIIPNKCENALKLNMCYSINNITLNKHPIGYIKLLENPPDNPWELLPSVMFTTEKCIKIANSLGLHQVLWLIDIQHLRYKTIPPMAVLKQIAHLLQHYYPERLYRAYVLFAPWIFKAVWKLVSPLLTENTKNKIVMIDWNNSTKFETFKHMLSKDNLEVTYGGENFQKYSYQWEINMWDKYNGYNNMDLFWKDNNKSNDVETNNNNNNNNDINQPNNSNQNDDTNETKTNNDNEINDINTETSNNNDNDTTNDDIKPETSNNDTTNNDGSNNDTINDDINDETQ